MLYKFKTFDGKIVYYPVAAYAAALANEWVDAPDLERWLGKQEQPISYTALVDFFEAMKKSVSEPRIFNINFRALTQILAITSQVVIPETLRAILPTALEIKEAVYGCTVWIDAKEDLNAVCKTLDTKGILISGSARHREGGTLIWVVGSAAFVETCDFQGYTNHSMQRYWVERNRLAEQRPASILNAKSQTPPDLKRLQLANNMKETDYSIHETLLDKYVPICFLDGKPIERDDRLSLGLGAQYLLYLNVSLLKLIDQPLITESMFEEMTFIFTFFQNRNYRTPLLPNIISAILTTCTDVHRFQARHAELRQAIQVLRSGVSEKVVLVEKLVQRKSIREEIEKLPVNGWVRAGKEVEEQEQGNPTYILRNPRAYERAQGLVRQDEALKYQCNDYYHLIFMQMFFTDSKFETACHQAFSEKLETAFTKSKLEKMVLNGIPDHLPPEQKAALQQTLNRQLLEAVSFYSSTKTIQSLIQRGASLDAIAAEGQFQGYSVLMLVIRTKRLDILQYILPLITTAQLHYQSPTGLNAVELLVQDGWTEGFECFNSQYSLPDLLPKFLINTLRSYHTDIETLLKLVDKCAPEEINYQGKFGESLLNRAVMMLKPDQKLIQLLLSKGANPRLMESLTGRNPWLNAIANGEIHVVKMLYDFDNSLIHEVDAKGNTVLMCAVNFLYGNLEVVQFLVTHGADIRGRNHAGKTAIDMAMGETKKFLQTCLKSAEVVSEQQRSSQSAEIDASNSTPSPTF